MKQFTHLHVHSWFSLLDGVCKPDELALAAKGNRMTALALTDHGNMYGMFDHAMACERHGIKPIFGCEFYLAENLADKGGTSHLTVLARTKKGLRNLYRLSTASFVEGFYKKARIDLKTLGDHAEGLIVLGGCMMGKAQQLLIAGDSAGALNFYRQLAEMCPDRAFLELMPLAIPEVVSLNERLVQFSLDNNVPLVVTNDVHYATKSQVRMHKAIMFVNTRGRLTAETSNLWLKDRSELCETFRTVYPNVDRGFLAEAMDRSVSIAESVRHIKLDRSPKYPAFRSAETT